MNGDVVYINQFEVTRTNTAFDVCQQSRRSLRKPDGAAGAASAHGSIGYGCDNQNFRLLHCALMIREAEKLKR